MKPLRCETSPEVDLTVIDRLRRFPREPDWLISAVRSVVALIIRAWLRFYFRFEIVGHQHLRTNRSLVLVANHASHLDTLCLLAALPLRRLHRAFPAAAEDYFFRSVSRTWFAAVILNALPFARQANVRQTLSVCGNLLDQPGNILIIFPEGTRSRDGRIQEFKCGIGALVAGRDVTVVPCRLDGAFHAWPKGKRLPRPRKVRLVVGKPRSYALRSGDKAAIASELEDAVRKL